jgi:hypothetical protein
MHIPFEVHEAGTSFTQEYMELLSNPAHWLFELTFSIIFDFIVISLLYGIIIKKVIIPRLKKTLHDEIDKEHGVEAHE